MIEIPVDDAWKGCVCFQILNFKAVAVGCHAVIPCRLQDILPFGSVARNAAVTADFFQRNPFSVIGQDHVKRSCPALQSLQLDDRGDFYDAFFLRL